MGLILTWCGAIAACAYDPTTASTHYLGFQNGKWYHGAAGRVSLSTLARITPREVHSIAILAHFTN